MRKLLLAALFALSLQPAFGQLPPPVPGLPDAERRISYTISGTTCACSLGANLALYGDSNDFSSWVEVFINGTQVAFNDPVFGWTITSPSGPLANLARPITDGVLTFNSVQTGTIQIVGARRPRRTAQFNENTGVPARNLNQALTDVVAMLREVWDKINDVTGRVVRAPPGETMTTLPPAASRASKNACFDSGGNLIPCVLTSAGNIAAGNGVSVTGSNPAVIAANIAGSGPIVVTPGATDTIGCPTCSTFIPPTTNTATVSTRTAAAALNLSAFTAITTQGYATPGDGGGATFQLISSSNNFLDSQVSGLSITTPGSGCTNNTYSGVSPSGGSGAGLPGSGSVLTGTATVAGGVLTAYVISGTGGNAYKVGDVLTIPNNQIACSNQPVMTVTSVTAPNGSFTDAAGNKFQIISARLGPINVRQFGAVGNYIEATGDAAATNDQGPIQAALRYAAAGNGTTDGGGTSGATVMVPGGGFLVCGGLQVPQGVIFTGLSHTATLLKECDSDGITFPFITLGDPLNHQTAFFPAVQNMLLFGSANGTTATGMAMVYSRSAQNADAIKNLAIYSANRMCVKYEIGDGGTGMFGIHNTYCVPNGVRSPPIAMQLSGSLGFVIDGGSFFSVGGSLWSGTAISIGNTGTVLLDGVHCENLTTCINYDGSGGNPGLLDVRNGLGNSLLTNFVIVGPGSVSGNVLISTFAANGTTCSVIKAASCVATGKIVGPTAF